MAILEGIEFYLGMTRRQGDKELLQLSGSFSIQTLF
jgi:hypothetical protein